MWTSHSTTRPWRTTGSPSTYLLTSGILSPDPTLIFTPSSHIFTVNFGTLGQFNGSQIHVHFFDTFFTQEPLEVVKSLLLVVSSESFLSIVLTPFRRDFGLCYKVLLPSPVDIVSDDTESILLTTLDRSQIATSCHWNCSCQRLSNQPHPCSLGLSVSTSTIISFEKNSRVSLLRHRTNLTSQFLPTNTRSPSLGPLLTPWCRSTPVPSCLWSTHPFPVGLCRCGRPSFCVSEPRPSVSRDTTSEYARVTNPSLQ